MKLTCGLRGLVVMGSCLGAVGAPAAVRADCAAPADYYTEVSGTTVRVSPTFWGSGGCPGDGLLRVNSSTHEAVLITSCVDENGSPRYVDECVPPGDYQYGLKTPMACSPSSCGGTYYYGTVTLTDTVDGCQRTLAAPAAYTDPLPWGASDLICESTYGKGCASGGGSGAGPVLAVNALALAAGLWFLRRRARRAAPRA